MPPPASCGGMPEYNSGLAFGIGTRLNTVKQGHVILTGAALISSLIWTVFLLPCSDAAFPCCEQQAAEQGNLSVRRRATQQQSHGINPIEGEGQEEHVTVFTVSFALMSAPFSSSAFTTISFPLNAAEMRAVLSPCATNWWEGRGSVGMQSLEAKILIRCSPCLLHQFRPPFPVARSQHPHVHLRQHR